MLINKIKINLPLPISVFRLNYLTCVALLMIVRYLLALELKVAVSCWEGVRFHFSLNWVRSWSSESFSSFSNLSHSSRILVFLVKSSGNSSINFRIRSVPPASFTADDLSLNDCGNSLPEKTMILSIPVGLDQSVQHFYTCK